MFKKIADMYRKSFSKEMEFFSGLKGKFESKMLKVKTESAIKTIAFILAALGILVAVAALLTAVAFEIVVLIMDYSEYSWIPLIIAAIGVAALVLDLIFSVFVYSYGEIVESVKKMASGGFVTATPDEPCENNATTPDVPIENNATKPKTSPENTEKKAARAPLPEL